MKLRASLFSLPTISLGRPTGARDREQSARREEFGTQTALAEMLPRHLQDAVIWTSLENQPRSRLSGLFAKRRGVGLDFRI
jgi:hypothetical protein